MHFLLTGGSGFLGKYIRQSAENLGNVITIGRSSLSDIKCDLSAHSFVCEEPIQWVIHAAGKAHSVPRTEEEIKDFFSVNVEGTKNLLISIENQIETLKQFVFISTVAVYGQDYGIQIKEDAPLLGNSPYALSKIEAEKLVLDWCSEHEIPCVILRLPLLIGENPKGNLKRMMDGIRSGRYVRISDGSARKSMVSCTNVVQLIFSLKSANGIYNLTDGYHPSFKEVENEIRKQFNKKKIHSIPKWILQPFAYLGDGLKISIFNTHVLKKITSSLTFDDSKARQELNWNPDWSLSFLFENKKTNETNI